MTMLDSAATTGGSPTAPTAALRPAHRPTTMEVLGTPILLAVMFGATYLWIQSLDLDTIEARVLRPELLWNRTVEHLQLTVASTLIVLLIAVPLGILASRRSARRIVPFVLGVANIGQGVPSIGLLAVVYALFGLFGFWPVVGGLVAYSALPILRNTMVGLQQVDPTLIKASRGMGLSPLMVLARVELPLAVPVIFAGLRTALVINVGTAALAFLFGAGGLGVVIFNGIQLNRDPVLITGVVLVSGLALLVSYLADMAGRLLSPRGL